MGKKREALIQVRVSEDEKIAFLAKAEEAGVSLSELVRISLNRATIRKSGLTKELVREVARMGNNLNQVARWVNVRKQTGLVSDALQVCAHLIAIEREIKELADDR